MRKLYVVPKDVWLANLDLFSIQIGSHYIDLVDDDETPTHVDDIHASWAEGNDIESSMILMATTFHSETAEDMWEGLGAVAVMPHPTFEGNVSLSDTNLDATDATGKRQNGRHPHEGKKVRGHHIAALKRHRTLAFAESDTVLDLSRKAQMIHPEVRVRGLR